MGLNVNFIVSLGCGFEKRIAQLRGYLELISFNKPLKLHTIKDKNYMHRLLMSNSMHINVPEEDHLWSKCMIKKNNNNWVDTALCVGADHFSQAPA